MLTLYSSPSCASCRKAKSWLIKNNIPFDERNIIQHPITKEEFLNFLEKSMDGTEELISNRSKYFKDNNLDLDNLYLDELYDLIVKHPSLLRRPLLVDDKNLQVGFNEDEIRVFLPKDVRIFELSQADFDYKDKNK